MILLLNKVLQLLDGIQIKQFYILLGQALDNVAATVMWNALMSVDTFFVIGGCLLSYHTMKELDKTKGGNPMMWVMFYIHRYIR